MLEDAAGLLGLILVIAGPLYVWELWERSRKS
jgi:hypothetical protein